MKISLLPQDTSPTTSDYVPGNQASSTTTQRFKFSDLIALFWTLANIPAGGTSPITRDSELQSNQVVSGLLWTADAAGSTLLASMTAGTVYINGRRILITAVSHRAFTASKDTYVDILDNGDGTGTLVYTTVTNGAAAPALASNSWRIAKVITGASNIASAASIVQNGYDSLYNVFYTAPNMKSATNAGTISPANADNNFNSNGVGVQFTVPTATTALVTVSLGVVSTSDFEFQPEIWLDGVMYQRNQPAAAAGNASSRASVRGFTWVVQLAAGTHTISAGATFASGTALSLIPSAATIAVSIQGKVTA